MSSYKEEQPVWTTVRTSSFFGSTPTKKDNDALTSSNGSWGRKESLSFENNRTTSRTKSTDLNLSHGSSSPPALRVFEERKLGGLSEKNVPRRDNSMNVGIILKTSSATCIATSNYNYPVVNVEKIGDSTPRSSHKVTQKETEEVEDNYKQHKREHLRTQRDNLNWDLCNFSDPNPSLERKGSTSWKPVLSKGQDIEGLMNKVWNKQYKEAELYITILGAEVNTTRSLATTEVTIKIKGKPLGTFPYGQEMCLDIDDKPEGELSLQIHSVNRLNQRKKLGRCNIVLSKLEDGKALETWYSFSKKKRKGTFKSRGYLKVKVMWISAVTSNKDFLMAKENYAQITELLFDKEGVIVSALCRLYKEEDLAMALIRLFNSQKQTSFLLMNLMIREIYFSDDSATLFRNDSMATKSARIFFSLVGKSYLKRMILSFVAYVTCEIGKGNTYEVDPAKLKSADDLPTNAARLIVAAKKFLGPILDSCNELPVSIRLFFCNLSSVLRVRVKTGNPVGALFFLRFVLPAALFPSQYDLMDKPLDPPVFRAMVLVTKILQNLVNGCVFHEEYMTMFNTFITDNIVAVNAFFETLCTLPTPQNIKYDDELEPYTDEQLVKLLSIIVRKLHMFFDKMPSQIEADPLFLTARDKQHQLYLYAKLKTLFLERILTSETGDESEMKHT
eukprot:Phypoly_transcript_01185.p1 GENE.Phypoly_transcript_01185~~Phypoly_transcript_01185.p1  ORF type:complete len:673 (+),score=92.82 Phypoly_transcript_01185:134-2152(+)